MKSSARFLSPALVAAWLVTAGLSHAAFDPEGDTVSLQAGGPDAVVLHAFTDSDRLRFSIRLTNSMPAPAVILELDTDSNIATGAVSRASLLCPELTGLGVERRIELAAADSGVVVKNSTGEVLGTGAGTVSRFDTWLTIDVPVHLLGGSLSGARYAGLIGSNEVSDCLPDGAALSLDDQPQRILGGRVSGLEGGGLVLQNRGGSDLLIQGNGLFSFPTALEEGSPYEVSVLDSGSLACDVRNGSGAVLGADILDVEVACSRVEPPDLIFSDGFETRITNLHLKNSGNKDQAGHVGHLRPGAVQGRNLISSGRSRSLPGRGEELSATHTIQ